jgi:uncharacterized coiled-coil protein SlyX
MIIGPEIYFTLPYYENGKMAHTSEFLEAMKEMMGEADRFFSLQNECQRRKMLVAIRASHEEIMAEMDAHYEKIIASQERTIAKMDAWLAEMQDSRKEMKATLETMEACLECKEPTSEEIESRTLKTQHRG